MCDIYPFERLSASPKGLYSMELNGEIKRHVRKRLWKQSKCFPYRRGSVNLLNL